MAKASGDELERLILGAKNSARISDDAFLDHLSQLKFEDSAILPILSVSSRTQLEKNPLD